MRSRTSKGADERNDLCRVECNQLVNTRPGAGKVSTGLGYFDVAKSKNDIRLPF